MRSCFYEQFLVADSVNSLSLFVRIPVGMLFDWLTADRAYHLIRHLSTAGVEDPKLVGGVITVPLKKSIIRLECSMSDRAATMSNAAQFRA
jgi:hypothetical protein